MAPPVTPSPHRFLQHKDGKSSQVSGSLKPSQFKQRPSFTFNSSARFAATESIPSDPPSPQEHDAFVQGTNTSTAVANGPSQSRRHPPNFTHLRPTDTTTLLATSFDTIDDGSQDDRTHEEHSEEATPADVREPSHDTSADVHAGRGDDDDIQPFKRLKLTASQRYQLNPADQPTSSRAVNLQAGHKFILSPPRTRVESNAQVAAMSHRQAFIRAASPEEDRSTIDAHLLQFSPQRKGKIYEPGGLAATMQGHLMDMTFAGSYTAPGRAQSQWAFKIDSVIYSAQFILVYGEDEDGRADKFILAGSKMIPTAGDVVQVRGMTWFCELDGLRWLVCVDWTIIK